MGLNVVIRHFLFRLPAVEPSYDVSQIFQWLVASADWDSFQPQRTAINPGAVKLGRTPSTTSHSYLSTFQWNQLLLQQAPAPTLYVLFLQTKRVWLWKESQAWSRKPSWAAPAGCKIYLKSVSMETSWCVRAAWRIHVDIITIAIYCSLSFTCYCRVLVFTQFPLGLIHDSDSE